MALPIHEILRPTIPAAILRQVQAKRVVETSFGAGPSYCVGRVEAHEPAIGFDQALAILERYNQVMRAGCIVFEDRSLLWFQRNIYERYQRKAPKQRPRPGLTVKTTEGPVTLRWDVDPEGEASGEMPFRPKRQRRT
jgi:hypothetical protein